MTSTLVLLGCAGNDGVDDSAGSDMGGVPTGLSNPLNDRTTRYSSGTPCGIAIPSTVHLALGIPSSAVPCESSENDYLIVRPQYALSYNNSEHVPNWVSWHLATEDFGNAKRRDAFKQDRSLPSDWYASTNSDYKGAGFDRGHLCPSADRTRTTDDNQATFLFTNVVPQRGDVNQGPWDRLENESRALARSGKELFIVAGGIRPGASEHIGRGIGVPELLFKIVVVLDRGRRSAGDVSAKTRVIAVLMPNDDSVAQSDDWRKYRVSVRRVEREIRGNFLSNVPSAIQDVVETQVDAK